MNPVAKNLVRDLFHQGLVYKEIRFVASERLNTDLSRRQIHHILKSCNLFRRKSPSDILDVAVFIEKQLTTSSKLHGYRWMHLKCRQNALNVDKETVRLLLKVLDPEGVEDRRRHRLTRRLYRVGGPNFIWHMDSYDKLKPYGICINGCIDGFSRYVTWLEAYSTSSDPKIISGYYTTAIDKLGGYPAVVRSDFGTENSHVKAMQMFLRRNGNDEFAANKSFIAGTSVQNQRIECWWGVLRKHCVQYWRNMFQVLKENGEFSGDIMDIALIQFCFLNIIQDELDRLVYEWNNHKISRSNQAEGPFGRPFVMYSTPQMYGVENYLVPIDDIGLNLCKEECVYKSKYPCDKDFFDFFTILMVEHNLSAPENPDRALDLYRNLRRLALDVL